jgi:hypothetical protein
MVAMDFAPDPEWLRRKRENNARYYSRLRELVDPEHKSGGVSRERIERVLWRLGRAARNEVSVVVALLDDDLPNDYSQVQEKLPFSAGASTQHIFHHVGILQHGEKPKTARTA